MAAKTEVTAAIVRELLDYNPETGELRWRERDVKWFDTGYGIDYIAKRSAKTWNTRYAGKPALKNSTRIGYYQGGLLGHMYSSHRIIFLHMTGRWPKDQMDHINRNRKDNRWINLREATGSENQRNRYLQKRNRSGYSNIVRVGKKYQVHIANEYLGRYATLEEAIAARKNAAQRLGCSPTHGEPRP